MSETPVEAGQWRRGLGSEVWAVLWAHPRRRGFWICAGSIFPYAIESIGRRELEAMPIASADYFGKRERHPGEIYAKAIANARAR